MRRAWVAIGPMVETVAILLQLRWHAQHPDTEPLGNLFLAHAGIYVGAAVGAWGAWAWMRDARWRSAALLVLTGALVRLVAALADGVAHAQGASISPMHDAYRAGIGVGLVGVGAAAVALVRVRRAAGGRRARRRPARRGPRRRPALGGQAPRRGRAR